MAFRRRVSRQAAGWSDKYQIDTDPRGEWHDCLVVDMSILGVGLEQRGAVPGHLEGQRLAVAVRTPVGTSMTIHLMGEVKWVMPTPEGAVRAGLEFVGLSETERPILDALERELWALLPRHEGCGPIRHGLRKRSAASPYVEVHGVPVKL